MLTAKQLLIMAEHWRHAFSCNTQRYHICFTASFGYKRWLFEQQWTQKNQHNRQKKDRKWRKFCKKWVSLQGRTQVKIQKAFLFIKWVVMCTDISFKVQITLCCFLTYCNWNCSYKIITIAPIVYLKISTVKSIICVLFTVLNEGLKYECFSLSVWSMAHAT